MMRELDLEMVRALTHGATVTEKDGLCHVDRFTEEQRNVFSGCGDFLRKTCAASCVRTEFTTDAEVFVMDVVAEKASSRLFYYFDIIVNGTLVRCEGADSYLERPEFHLEIPLDGKMNHVCVYFPCLTKISLKRVAFSGGSVIAPVPKKHRVICFGDSITQGYDARHPCLTYPNQIADALDADVFNKGIGGDIFDPALAACPDPFVPDLITVAYGTNDWVKSTKDQLLHDAKCFFENLTCRYPETPVLAILPIWRKDHLRTTTVGSFSDARNIIRTVCLAYPAVQIADGLELVPHLEECFSPDGVHPNDFGFQFMGRNLLRHLPRL